MKLLKLVRRSTQLGMLFMALLAGLYAHAQNRSAPMQGLKGNWFLSSNTNQWVLGFYEKLGYFNGGFGEYSIIEEKKNAFTIKLLTDKKETTLLIHVQDDSTIAVNAEGRTWTLTNQRKRQSSAATAFWDKRWKRTDDTVRLKGYISEPARNGLRELHIVFTDPVLGKMITETARVSAEGLFNMSIPIVLPDTEAFIRFNSRVEHFLACPGDTITVCLLPEGGPEESPLNEIAFGGTSGALNNELNTLYKYLTGLEDQTLQNHMLKNTTQEAYREYVLGMKYTADSAITAYEKKYALSAAVRDVMEKKTHYQMRNGLLRYRMYHNPLHPEPLDPETLKLLPLWMANDSAGYAGGYHHKGFINEMINLFPDEIIGDSHRIDSANAANFSLADFMSLVKRHHHSLTEQDLLMLDSIAALAPFSKLKNNGFIIDVPEADSTALARGQRMFGFLQQLNGVSDYYDFYFFSLAFDYKLKRIAAEYPKGYFRDYFLGQYLNTQVFSTHLTFLDDKLLAYLKTLIYDPLNFKSIESASKLHEKNLKLWVQNGGDEEEYEEEGEEW